MIINNICENCNHSVVCDIKNKKLSPFSEQAKNPLPTTIKIVECEQYQPVDEDYETEE